MNKAQLRHALSYILPYLFVTIAFTYSVFTIHTEHDNRIATLCRQSRASWDERTELAQILTEPTVLSPEAAKLFPSSQTDALRLQIDNSNARKLVQRDRLATINGPKPMC